MIKPIKITVLDAEQAARIDVDGCLWDDNGGATDGYLFIVKAEDGPLDAKVRQGYEVKPYTGAIMNGEKQSMQFCGWQSAGYAYAADKFTADMIEKAEIEAKK